MLGWDDGGGLRLCIQHQTVKRHSSPQCDHRITGTLKSRSHLRFLFGSSNSLLRKHSRIQLTCGVLSAPLPNVISTKRHQ